MKINSIICLLSTFLVFTPFKTNYDDFYQKQNDLDISTKIKKAYPLNAISTKSDFIKLLNESNTDSYSIGKDFEIVNDIDLEGAIINPIPIFSGTLNGNNHTIKNFKIDPSSSGNEVGFIRILTETGSIKNLNLSYEMEVKNDDTSVGGLVGTNKGTIDNCTFSGKIKGRHIVGGLVGVNEKEANIINSENKGNIIAKIFCGGICGFNKGTILSSKNFGIINDSRFSSTDELTLSNIGGIVGFNQNKIQNCINYGNVGQKQLGTFVGGICGTSIGQIENCSNYGIVKGDTNIGGIIGSYAEFSKQDKNTTFNQMIDLLNNILNNKTDNQTTTINDKALKSSSLKYCFNSGIVSGETNVGGIAGYSANALNALDKRVFDINNCVNVSSIESSRNSVGGIVGNQLNGKVYECFSVGNIKGKLADNVGGLVGYSGGEIAYSFVINDMIGGKYVGGIAGHASSIHDCYSISKIETKNVFNGAIAGEIEEINDKVSNNYYVNDDYYGIDNIDYENVTTKLTKDELASSTDITINLNKDYFSVLDKKSYPLITSFLNLESDSYNNNILKDTMIASTKFGSYVNFLDEDGEIIKKILVEYNQNLDEKEIPSVPEKEGYFARWSDFNLDNITSNLYIRPIYDQIVTTIASSEGPKPTVLVEGKFYSTTKLNATVSEINTLDKKSKYTFIKEVTIDLFDDINEINKDNIKFKISLPNKYEKIRVGIKDGNKIKILESKVDGTYIVFNGQDVDEYFILDERFANLNNPWFITTIVCCSILGVGVISGITFGIIYHKKKKLNK